MTVMSSIRIDQSNKSNAHHNFSSDDGNVINKDASKTTKRINRPTNERTLFSIAFKSDHHIFS